MASEHSPGQHRFCLPPGTVVEDWCLLGCEGHGACGIVYRAVRVGQESAGPVALKMALYPWDPRFMREVGLLTLVHHPSVPRLYGHGFWRHPSGTCFPFIVMEWVEGLSLYAWAREHHPTSQQLSRALAQLARALEATHEASAVHRDVKGENVLVRRTDGRAMLTDFGAGHYQAAARLTWQPMPPGTPAYQSPESGLFQIRAVRTPDAHYVAGPADDVFALGVTAYRLVTGEYPPSAEPRMDEEGTWHMVEARRVPPSERNPLVAPALSALILRMLSLAPEARGTARELAEALEAMAEHAGAMAVGTSVSSNAPRETAPAARAALPETVEAVAMQAPFTPARPRGRARARMAASAMVLAGAFLVLWAWQAVEVRHQSAASGARVASEPGKPDTGPAGLGDKAAAAAPASVQEPSKKQPVAQEPPPEPYLEQVRPNAKGRCPGRKQVPINGGCWVEFPSTDAAECEQNSLLFFKGRCYAPVMESRRKPPPTSDLPQ